MKEFNLSEKRSPEMMKKLFVYSEEDVKEFIQKLEDFRNKREKELLIHDEDVWVQGKFDGFREIITEMKKLAGEKLI